MGRETGQTIELLAIQNRDDDVRRASEGGAVACLGEDTVYEKKGPEAFSELTSDPILLNWLRGRDLNPRPLGYEPNELPDCSTPR